MKARLLGLLLLCCGLLFALSLMVVEADAPRDADAPQAYIQSAAVPLIQAMPDEQGLPKVLPRAVKPRSLVPPAVRDFIDLTGPKQTMPYYEHAYYAFHFSDEAG